MIDWICLNCGKKLEVPEARAGTEEPCPACGELVRLPLTPAPIPPYPPTRTGGTIAIPGDFTVGSLAHRAESQAILARYRLWRRRGLILGLVPSVIAAGVIVLLNVVNQTQAGESAVSQLGHFASGLVCAAFWGGLLGASLGTILSRWFVRQPAGEDH